MDLIGAAARDDALGPDEVRRFLSDNPDFLKGDPALLRELGLRPEAANNVVEFGPAALAGADCATIPPSVFVDLFKHPLTEKGLDQFLSDWAKTGQSIV